MWRRRVTLDRLLLTLRLVAFEIGYKIRNLIYLVFYNMYTPPQPYDKKLCSGFLAARMELGAALIFLVVPSPESVHDTAARHPGMWKFKAKWRPKRTSLVVQDRIARNRALRDRSPKTVSSLFSSLDHSRLSRRSAIYDPAVTRSVLDGLQKVQTVSPVAAVESRGCPAGNRDQPCRKPRQ